MPYTHLQRVKRATSLFTGYLYEQMHLRNLSQEDMAAVINVSQPAFSKKMANNIWSLTEIIEIFDYLKPSDEDILRTMRIPGERI